MWMSHTIEKRRGTKSEGLLKNGVDVQLSSRCRTACATIGMPGVGARPQGGWVVPDMAPVRSEWKADRIGSNRTVYSEPRDREEKKRYIKCVK